MGRRTDSRSPSPDPRHRSKASKHSKDSRRFRRSKADVLDEDAEERGPAKAAPGQDGPLAPLTAEALEEASQRIEAEVRRRVAAILEAPETARRIEVRLKEERAKLEEAVTRQVEEERLSLLARKRREQEERQRQREELERILEENQRKLEEAQKRAEEERGGAKPLEEEEPTDVDETFTRRDD